MPPPALLYARFAPLFTAAGGANICLYHGRSESYEDPVCCFGSQSLCQIRRRPETAETISMLREQTERLSKMVRTLLDMSDLKAVPRTDKIQLAPMIEEVLADLSPLAEKSGVALSQSGEDLWITGSDVLVYRSIFNLVENGVKYNHPGGSVRVAASRRGSSAVIEVRDTGCGIPENFRESVFQPFFRVDKSRSREKGGVGLGLSLVWEIAQLHGGSVRITESGKDGTVIELTLPISAEEQGIPCG